MSGTPTKGFEAQVRKRIKNSDLNYRAIADGSKVGLSWLQKFAVDRANDYGIRLVQAVDDFLERHEKRAARKRKKQ